MSYNLSHLQHTINYIIEQLEYADENLRQRKLSNSDKKWAAEELFVAIHPLQARNPKNIAINVKNTYLNDFFVLLHNSKIQFPVATTYLLKRTGLSYELHDNNRKEIYNKHKSKAKVAGRRSAELASLTDKLSDLTIDELTVDENQSDSEITYTPHFATFADYLQDAKPVSPIYTRHMTAKL